MNIYDELHALVIEGDCIRDYINVGRILRDSNWKFYLYDMDWTSKSDFIKYLLSFVYNDNFIHIKLYAECDFDDLHRINLKSGSMFDYIDKNLNLDIYIRIKVDESEKIFYSLE